MLGDGGWGNENINLSFFKGFLFFLLEILVTTWNWFFSSSLIRFLYVLKNIRLEILSHFPYFNLARFVEPFFCLTFHKVFVHKNFVKFFNILSLDVLVSEASVNYAHCNEFFLFVSGIRIKRDRERYKYQLSQFAQIILCYVIIYDSMRP